MSFNIFSILMREPTLGGNWKPLLCFSPDEWGRLLALFSACGNTPLRKEILINFDKGTDIELATALCMRAVT